MWFRWNKSDGKEKLVAQIVTGNAHLYFILNVIKQPFEVFEQLDYLYFILYPVKDLCTFASLLSHRVHETILQFYFSPIP